MIVARITLRTPDGDVVILESQEECTISEIAARIIGEYLDGAGLAQDPALSVLLSREVDKATAVLSIAGITVGVE